MIKPLVFSRYEGEEPEEEQNEKPEQAETPSDALTSKILIRP